MKRIIAVFIVLFLSNCCTFQSSNFGNISEREVAQLSKSVVQLRYKMSPYTYGIASGFALDEYRIVTAGHFCVNVHFDQNIKEELELIEAWGINYSFTDIILKSLVDIESVDEELDICVLKSFIKHKIRPIKIALPYEMKVREKVMIIGGPAGNFPSEEVGHIVLPKSKFMPPLRMTLNIPGTLGSSGSAVLNENGEVIGIIIEKDRNYDHSMMAVRLEDLRNFLEQQYGAKFLERQRR